MTGDIKATIAGVLMMISKLLEQISPVIGHLTGLIGLLIGIVVLRNYYLDGKIKQKILNDNKK